MEAQLLTEARLTWVGCCNELNAGYAADGYARCHRGCNALLLLTAESLQELLAAHNAECYRVFAEVHGHVWPIVKAKECCDWGAIVTLMRAAVKPACGVPQGSGSGGVRGDVHGGRPEHHQRHRGGVFGGPPRHLHHRWAAAHL